jgi:hypothetical protein
VIDRIHGDTANRRSHSAPSFRAGFTEFAQIVLTVADFTDGGAAVDMNPAHFT